MTRVPSPRGRRKLFARAAAAALALALPFMAGTPAHAQTERARLVFCPDLRVAVAEVEARGRDGSLLTMRKEQPATGVSGNEMFESQFAAIVRAAGRRETLSFV